MPETFARAAPANGRLEILLGDWSSPFPAPLKGVIAAISAAQRTIKETEV